MNRPSFIKNCHKDIAKLAVANLAELTRKGLAKPPKWLPENIHYETIMGSLAYGVSSESSDFDVYGFGIPPKELIFPHLAGEIPGFGTQLKRFEQYQEHHIEDKGTKKEYDFSIFSIVKYFQLCMENNPNMIDSLFTPETCILTITKIGQMVRDNRKLFLHRGAWHKFKGYAYQQVHKIRTKTPDADSKRRELIDKFGYDVKFAYHTVRLLNEIEQILTEGDLDLMRNSEQLKSIRRGDWKEEEVVQYFQTKERDLEKLYNTSLLPYGPDEAKIKSLLLSCLEAHYGSLDKAIHVPDKYKTSLLQIQQILDLSLKG